MGIIIFNGQSSEDYNVMVEHKPDYEHPEKDYDVIHVPGRNGDIIVDKGSWKNITRSYDIAFHSVHDKDFVYTASGVSQWLHAPSGYARLEDSYEPEYYRMAVYKESGSFTNILAEAGRATISFDCKPQRFLKSGEFVHKFIKETCLKNPTAYDSLPKIIIYGSGSGVLTVNGSVTNISSIGNGMVIDSELQDAYHGTSNWNKYITLNNHKFPRLKPGENLISFSGGITSVEVIPRWWTL